MPVINLADYLPPAADGSKSLLPKQAEFFNSALDVKGPKYIGYIGGIGSGKSVIGCETMLALATLEAGDYLIARQYMPELKMTTYKTFLELCPPELIIEHRIADAMIKLRSRNGVANIYFRPLEEPDKLRSLNLNAFLIDEANQVTEEAFLLLQGRLRGRAWRKGFVVSNPNGHDFIYRLFFVRDFKNEWVKAQFKLIRAPSTENVHLPEGYLASLVGAWSEERIQREIEGSFDAFEGAVYTEFRRDLHVIKPFAIPTEWPRYIGIDHGMRNPEAWVWVAVGPDGEAYVYREYYQTEMTIEEIIKGKRLNMNDYCMGTLARMRYGTPSAEKIIQAVIDPSTKNRKGNGESDWDEYTRHLPAEFPLYKAQNDVQVGIDRVKGYLKVHDKIGKPSLFIFETCTNLIEELTQYKYAELRSNQEGKKAENEKPMKVNDHACLAGNTTVQTSTGPKAIRDIQPGDMVLTSLGYCPAKYSQLTGVRQVFEITLSSGDVLRATGDHPVLTGKGVVAAKDLTPCDTLCTLPVWLTSRSMALFLGKLVTTTELTARTAAEAWSLFTEKCGSTTEALFLRGTRSTTGTKTQTTTISTTWNVFPLWNTTQGTERRPLHAVEVPARYPIWPKSDTLLRDGTEAQRAKNGIGNTLSLWQRRFIAQTRKWLRPVSNAVKSILPSKLRHFALSSAIRIVKLKPCGVEEVYNLVVDGVSEFYANGILVSNCDALRYVIMLLPEAYKPEVEIKPTYATLQSKLGADIASMKAPKSKDPFAGF